MVKVSEKNPKVRCWLNGRRQLLEDIEVEWNGIRFTVPEGYDCDGSSIPRFFWRVVGSPTTGPNLLSGIVHDYLYQYHLFPRDLCDLCFKDVLVHLGKRRIFAWMMYRAVRWFGGKHY